MANRSLVLVGMLGALSGAGFLESACAGSEANPDEGKTTASSTSASSTSSGGGQGGAEADAVGDPCEGSGDCKNGVCKDGYCCNSPCNAICQACNLAGTEGFCGPAITGTDPDGDCPEGQLCNSQGKCEGGQHLWSKRFGGATFDGLRNMVLDGAGNIVMVGYFSGAVDFGKGELKAGEGRDIFLAKLDPQGQTLWSKGFALAPEQCTYYECPLGLAVGADGSAVLAGGFEGTLNLGGGPLGATGRDAFVAKFSADGAHLWSKSFAAPDNQFAEAVALDQTGNIVVAGAVKGEADFGGGPLASADADDIFVVELDPNGAHLWSKIYGGTGNQRVRALAVDAQGGVYLTGHFEGKLEFAGKSLAGANPNNVLGGAIFLARLQPDGKADWADRYGDSADHDARSIAIDSFGNLILTGWIAGTVDFGGGGVLATQGGYDVFLAKFSPGGKHIWSKSFGADDYQYAYRTVVDEAGKIYLAGEFLNEIDFGTGPKKSVGASDAYLGRFAKEGTEIRTEIFGGPYDQKALAVAVDAKGNVIIAGDFRESFDLGGGELASAGDFDVFVAKFAP
ncbi:MAG: hypothetical protein HY744_07840 [Deltaproteobacteria bacterium]|nr:hypothetical protein [Deltaproteobacteria bacterium]